MVKQRASLESIPAYKQGASPKGATSHKLSSNENPFAPLPSVLELVRNELDHFQQYPSIAAPEITQRLADLWDVDPACLAFGAGSVEVAGQLVSASCDAADEVIFAWRSFEAYPILTKVAGATPVMVPLNDELGHDFDAMVEAITDRTRLIFVCNPNNPTGTVSTRAEVERFIERVPSDILVVIDEAYLQFNRDPETAVGIECFRKYDNVAVLHTFSKAYGLAGLRIGYAIAPLTVAENLRKVAVPFGVSDMAQRAAVASLDAVEELNERVEYLVGERERVTRALSEQGWSFPDTGANFVWLPTGEATVAVNDVLLAHGVIARSFPGDGIRVSIGSSEANDAFIDAAREALKVTTPSA